MAAAEPVQQPSSVMFEGVNPILRVADVKASVEYYVSALGFSLNWGERGFACVSRGKCHLFLCQGDQGHPGSWVWIGVSSADDLLEEYRRSGARIRHEPANYPWAWEMQVEDIDGNVLRMGSEPKEGRPRGEWLDMDGRRWLPQPDGWEVAD